MEKGECNKQTECITDNTSFLFIHRVQEGRYCQDKDQELLLLLRRPLGSTHSQPHCYYLFIIHLFYLIRPLYL